MDAADSHATEQASVYDAAGGAPVIAAVVDEFYARVLANPRLAAFFAQTTVDELKRHQREFLALALHGPAAYTGRPMREAHADRGIRDADFDRVLHHFTEALAAARVPEDVSAAALRTVEALRPEIVDAGAG